MHEVYTPGGNEFGVRGLVEGFIEDGFFRNGYTLNESGCSSESSARVAGT